MAGHKPAPGRRLLAVHPATKVSAYVSAQPLIEFQDASGAVLWSFNLDALMARYTPAETNIRQGGFDQAGNLTITVGKHSYYSVNPYEKTAKFLGSD